MEFRIGDHREAEENGKTFKLIDRLMGRSNRAIRQMMFLLMEDLHRSANQEIIHGIKTGRVYRVTTISKKGNKHRRNHQASAPGETHANLTGALRRSLSWKVHGSDSAEFGYGVSTTGENEAPEYADYVEFGTDKMEPRPTLKNELEHVDTKAQIYFNDALTDEGFGGK